jgi:hypothetical protein
MFSLQQNQRTRGKNIFCPERGGGRREGRGRRKERRGEEGAQTMYTHE